jgi:hypothetical protein
MHATPPIVVNLTPHDIVLRTPEGDITYPSHGLARVASIPGSHLGGCLWAAPHWGAIEGLPRPSEGVIYLVSALVAARCVGRQDVFSPGTGPLDSPVRDDQGRIVAVTRLIQAPMS